MPFQHATQPETSVAVAIGRTFGPASSYDVLRWSGHDGQPVAGAIGIMAVQQEGVPASWLDDAALRQTVLAVRYGELGQHLAVAQHFSLPNGEQPHRRRVRTNYRIGGATYDRMRGRWETDSAKYNDSALWQTSSLMDMAEGLAMLASPDTRNPRHDPLAHLQLHRIMYNLRLQHGFNFQEPLINYLVSHVLADTARVVDA